MKNVLSIVLLVVGVGFANAQTEQGSWLVGATSDLSFTSTSIDGVNDNASSFNLNVLGGYFFADNFTAGLNLGFASSSQGDFSSNSFAIGPFARYYVNGAFFLGASFSAINGTQDTGTVELDFSASVLGLEGGYPIWIVDNVSIEPAIIYNIQTSDDIGDANTFGINVGFNLYF